MSNEHLHKARKARNDEFFTRLVDIEKELSHYQDQLEGLWVYSSCSDYRWSNFVKYFKDNFKKLNLKRYTSTCYDIGDGAWRYDYDGETETITQLKENGDFRSPECTAIKDACDIVIENPPFSLWRDFIYWLNDGTFHKNDKGEYVRDK